MAEKKIGSRTFKAEKIPAIPSTELLFRLGKAAAPFMTDPEILKGQDDATAIKAIVSFFQALDYREATSLVVTLCEHSKVMGPSGAYEPVIYDAHFADSILDAFQVAAFVALTNYSDFFGGKLAGLFSSLKQSQ